MPSKILADDSLIVLFVLFFSDCFSKKVRLDITDADDSHEMSSINFSENNINEQTFKMSSSVASVGICKIKA